MSSSLSQRCHTPESRSLITKGGWCQEPGGGERRATQGLCHREGGIRMGSHRFFRRHRWVGMLLVLCIPLRVLAQQATKSDAALAREGALALAAAHGDKPRYGGTFFSAGNEEIPFYDMHQTASITASATFGHSASPDNVTCWYIITLQ